MLDPTSVFGDPFDVVRSGAITREQKIEILRRWEYDAKELVVADEENMINDSQKPDLLSRIHDALYQLGAAPADEA